MPGTDAAIIFDLDGTLVDTAPDLTRALNATLAGEGLARVSPKQARLLIGGGAQALIERGLRSGRGPKPEAREAWNRLARLEEVFLEHYARAPARDSRPFPGLSGLLASLHQRGIKLGVCTNKRRDLAESILTALDLRRFFDAVTGGGAIRKPDPAPLLATLAALGVPPERAIMIGDSRIDAETARRAGAKLVLVTFGYETCDLDTLGADLLLDSYCDPSALDGMISGLL